MEFITKPGAGDEFTFPTHNRHLASVLADDQKAGDYKISCEMAPMPDDEFAEFMSALRAEGNDEAADALEAVRRGDLRVTGCYFTFGTSQT